MGVNSSRTERVLGCRFRWVEGERADFTVVSYDPASDEARVHLADGQRGALTGAGIEDGLAAGVLEESALAPFELPERATGAARRTESGRKYVVVRRHGRSLLLPADTYGTSEGRGLTPCA